MTYVTTGLCHRVGVINERKIVALLNDAMASGRDVLKLIPLFGGRPLKFVHAGGTQQVADMVVHDASTDAFIAGVSIKNHSNGSFDHINTSRVADYVPSELDAHLKSSLRDIKDKFYGKAEHLPQARKEINSIFEGCWEHWTSEALRRLLQNIKKRTPELVIINNVKQRTLLCYRDEAFEEISKYPFENSWKYELKATRAKTSRSIWRRNDGEDTVNTHLRVRHALNNGVTALLGMSKANKVSIPTVKIQQDGVDILLKRMVPHAVCVVGSPPKVVISD